MSTQPFKPSCSVCVTECDSNSVYTNCNHFLCSRCVAKSQKSVCPRCQKPYKAILLGAPNFPRDLAERFSCDTKKNLQVTLQALDFQQKASESTTTRLKELLTTVGQSRQQIHQQLVATQQECQQLAQQLSAATEENKRLVVANNVLKEQLQSNQRDLLSNVVAGGGHHMGERGGGGAERRSQSAVGVNDIHSFADDLVGRHQMSHSAATPQFSTPSFLSPLDTNILHNSSNCSGGRPLATPSSSGSPGSGFHVGWSPSWARGPAATEKRPRDDSRPGTAQGGGTYREERFSSLVVTPQVSLRDVALNAIRPVNPQQPTPPPALAAASGGSTMMNSFMRQTPQSAFPPSSAVGAHSGLPRLQSLLPSMNSSCGGLGAVRVVHSSSGHDPHGVR